MLELFAIIFAIVCGGCGALLLIVTVFQMMLDEFLPLEDDEEEEWR